MMTQKIAVLDYGMGNHFSVVKRLMKFNCDAFIAHSKKEINEADKIILPGVGHFANAAENIKGLEIWDSLNEAVLIKKKPILGICLGMQLMAKNSEEGNADGLGWFDANVVRFKVSENSNFKIPHIGWNTVTQKKDSALLKDIPNNSEFYFVHAYHMKTSKSQDILSESNYAYDFVSAVEQENIFGVQFHPEKSHELGNLLLQNFTKL
jgi:glutamine amidotransferase